MIRLICAVAFSFFVLGLNISPVCAQRTDFRYGTPGPGNWSLEEQQLKAHLRELNADRQSGFDDHFARNGNGFDNAHLIALHEDLLRPTRAERAPYTQFLKQPHAGIVRLLQQGTKLVIVENLSKDRPTRLAFPGAYYSFTSLGHVGRPDLNLKDGNLEVAFGPDAVGAITILGDVPIDSLTIESPGVNTLARYAPPSERNDAQNEYRRFKDGVTIAGYSFQTQVPVLENTTYALRSIAYGRSDLLIAVRVVKLDSDGGVLMLWKRIDKFSAPKLKATGRK